MQENYLEFNRIIILKVKIIKKLNKGRIIEIYNKMNLSFCTNNR